MSESIPLTLDLLYDSFEKTEYCPRDGARENGFDSNIGPEARESQGLRAFSTLNLI
jgi:hypothetical protein